MGQILQDLRFGARLLIRDRSFTITAVLTLAICIAANTVMFSIVRTVLLKPLPFSESDRLVFIYNSYPKAGAARAGAAVPDYFDRTAAVPALTELGMYRRDNVALGDERGAERLVQIRGTPSFFRLLRVQPVRGRLFSDAEGEPGASNKVILSYGFWQRKFGGDESVVGRTIRLDGTPMDVIGVAPQTFTFLQHDVEVFTPAAFTPRQKADDQRHSNSWQMVGRMVAGASLQLVQQQIEALNALNDTRYPEFRQILKDAQFRTLVVSLQNDVVRDVRGVLYLLWGGVLFVLLIGCVNIAHLVMVRVSARTRELATRHAIGGDLSRLAAQLLTETILLSSVGGVLGLLTGWWALRYLGALNLDQLPRGYEIAIDPVTVLVIVVLTALVGILTGLAPVTRLARMNLNTELREDSRGGTSGRRANVLRRALATAQVAIALMLLVGAGLLFASFRAVLRLDFGFTPANVVTASVNLPAASYADNPAQVAFESRALQSLRALPGVETVGATADVPFGGAANYNLIFAEGYTMQPGESVVAPVASVVSAGYFEAMRIPVVRGRAFDARDTASAPKTTIIDERLARKFWPGRDPVGRRLYRPSDIKSLSAITPTTEFFTVIGVAREVQIDDPRPDVTAVGTYYFPYEQGPTRRLTFTVRTRQGAADPGNDIRREIAKIDPQLPVFRIQPLQEWIDRALVGRRLPMLVAMAFGFVALFLSAIGIYGVLAYSVSQRQRELGVRMALGGSGSAVFGLVLRDGLQVVGTGIGIGLMGAFFVGQVMKSQLFAVAPTSPLVLAFVSIVLLAVAMVAVSIPALRASRIDPVIALAK